MPWDEVRVVLLTGFLYRSEVKEGGSALPCTMMRVSGEGWKVGVGVSTLAHDLQLSSDPRIRPLELPSSPISGPPLA